MSGIVLAMTDSGVRKLVKWPFLAADVLLVAAAFYIVFKEGPPHSLPHLALAIVALICGGAAGILPFITEYRVEARLQESAALGTVMAQIKSIEGVAAQISSATGNWQGVQEQSEKAIVSAKGIAERMTAEIKGFNEFMQKVNDNEKANLKLEVEKLRRGEGDWVGVLVRTMDHIHAIHRGALHSGQPNLIEQMTNFQNACRDAARRVGLVPFLPAVGDAFDPARHELIPGAPAPHAGLEGHIDEVIATGFTYQGRLLRPSLVKLQTQAGATEPPAGAEKERQEAAGQPELL